ncbi:hypothetical protein [Polaromonas sp. C04]|uniref:hypothetical protein n=1 Tax=Polaromonas sp. C04 TaxID=1945857 RepID=UPI0009860FFB|nr:hypothetical protein [Polaromonas sp. C04]OOG58817.1 hypothetical protein B0E49_02655 [Polaromonas sp. C04]
MYFISAAAREFYQYGARAYLFQGLADAWLDPRPQSPQRRCVWGAACAIIKASSVMIGAD